MGQCVRPSCKGIFIIDGKNLLRKQIDKKDKQFDMDLNRLETERTALTTEYDSVKKVIQDNIERTFGIFS